MRQATRYRGYIVGLERKNGFLLVSASPATPDLPILGRCRFEAVTQSEAEAMMDAKRWVDRVLSS